MCHVSGVRCLVPKVMCHVSRFTCDLSLTATATATDRPPKKIPFLKAKREPPVENKLLFPFFYDPFNQDRLPSALQ